MICVTVMHCALFLGIASDISVMSPSSVSAVKSSLSVRALPVGLEHFTV